jgi:hypothetical protein
LASHLLVPLVEQIMSQDLNAASVAVDPAAIPVLVPARCTETPIRFPHIPSRNVAPPASAAWFRAGESELRIDGDHNPPGSRKDTLTGSSGIAAVGLEPHSVEQTGIPGLRARPSAGLPSRSEAFDDRMLPEPSAPQDDALRQPADVLQPMLDQLRIRLLDFGNLLARDYPGDQHLESAFETVCRSYGQLIALRR